MQRIRALGLMLAVVLAVIVTACGDDEEQPAGTALDTKNPFRIAMVSDQTGVTANDTLAGAPGIAGAKAAVQYINEHGGILGRQVVLDLRDGGSDQAKALDVGTKLILSGDYQAMIALTLGSPELARFANRNKVLTFTANGDPVMQDPKQSYYIFDNSDQPNHQALASVCYIKTLPYKKVAIVSQPHTYSQVITDAWKANLPKFGIEVTGQEVTQFGQLDLTAQLTKLKATNPEAILDMLSGTDFGHLVDGMKNLRWAIPIVGESAMSSTNFEKALQSLGDIPKDSTMSAWGINVRLPSGPSEAQKRIIDALKAQGITKLDNPMYNYVYGWDPPFLIKYAAEKAKSDKADDMVKALETLDSVKDQSALLTALVTHHSYRPDFHGLLNGYFTSAKAGKVTDGLYEWGGKDYQFPCQ